MGVRNISLIAILTAMVMVAPTLSGLSHKKPPRLLQVAGSNPTVTTMVDVGNGFTSTFNGFMAPPFSAVHQAYDLRPSNNQTLNATLVFQPSGSIVPNQLTLLIPASYNVVNLQFSQSCVFPIAASSASLNGVDPATGRVTPQTAQRWLTIFTSNAFEVFAQQMAFGGLNSSIAGNTTVSYPQGSKVPAQNQGLYSQTLRFPNTTSTFRIIQIYCPLTDSGSGSWAINITGSWTPGPVIQTNTGNSTANTSNTTLNSTSNNTTNNNTNRTNNTNGTNPPSNNGSVDPNANNGQVPMNNSLPNPNPEDGKKVNTAALVVGLVLGILLLIALIAIVILCIRLSKKRRDISKDEGYGPQSGFKQFDKQEKMVNVADYNTGSGIHQTPTSNSLPADKNNRGKAESETGFGWRQNETVVVAEDENAQEDPFGRPAKYEA